MFGLSIGIGSLRIRRVLAAGLLPALLAGLLAAVLAAPEAAAKPSLSFGDSPTSASVTSGSEDQKVVKVNATGPSRQNRIRYSIKGHDAFDILARTGRITYDGSLITDASVQLTVTARDRRGKFELARLVIQVTVRQPANMQPLAVPRQPQPPESVGEIPLTASHATAPTVSTIAVTSTPKEKSDANIANADTYGAGETIEVTVTFDQAVTVTGVPSLNLQVGGSRTSAAYASGSGNAALVFSYTVVDVDRDDNGVSVPGTQPIALPTEASIRNASGEDANLRHSGIADQSGHKVDARLTGGTGPRIKSISIVSSPASGTTYGAGETIEVLVTWDQLVLGLNRPYPTLSLTFGTGGSTSLRTAQMAISRGDQTRFRYIVQSGDADSDGVSIPQDPLTVPSGSFIRNMNNNEDAVLTYAGLAAQSGHQVDGTDDNVRPSAPTHLSVTGGVNADREAWVSLSWKRSRDGTITGYQYQQNDNDWVLIPNSGPGTDGYRVTSGLARGTAYAFKVRAVDTGGDGAASPAVTVTWLKTRPFQPTGLGAVAGNGEVELRWTDPQDSTITRYEYQQREEWWQDGTLKYTYYGDWTVIPNSGAATESHTVSGLENGTTYYFRIRAVNDVGASSYSRDERATPTVTPSP